MKTRHALGAVVVGALIAALTWLAMDTGGVSDVVTEREAGPIDVDPSPRPTHADTSTEARAEASDVSRGAEDVAAPVPSAPVRTERSPRESDSRARAIDSNAIVTNAARKRAILALVDRLASMRHKGRLVELRSLMRREGARAIRDVLLASLGEDGEPRFGTRTSLHYGIALAEFRLDDKGAALDALLAALLEMPVPLEGVELRTRIDGRRRARLIMMRTDVVLFPGGRPESGPHNHIDAWSKTVRLLPGDPYREFVAWLIDRAETDEHAVRAAAATIWAHAIVYGGAQNYPLGITPAERRVADAVLPGQVDWDELTIESWYVVQDRIRALGGPDGHVEAQSQQAAWTTAMDTGEPVRSRLIPWSLERDVQRILDGNESAEAKKLRRLTAWLVERP